MNIRSVFMAALVLAAMSWAQTSSAPAASNTAALNQQNANNLCRFFFSDLKPGATAAATSDHPKASTARDRVRFRSVLRDPAT